MLLQASNGTLIGITNNGGFEGADPGDIFIIEPRLSAPKPLFVSPHPAKGKVGSQIIIEGPRDLWLNHCCRGGGCMQRKTGLRVVFLFTVLAIAGGYAVIRFWHPSLVESGIVWFLVAWIGGTTQLIKFELNDVWEKLGRIEEKLKAIERGKVKTG